MQLLTVDGQWEANYASVANDGMLYTQIEDKRPLWEIAKELEGQETVEVLEGSLEGEAVELTGYTVLQSIARTDQGAVNICLMKGW